MSEKLRVGEPEEEKYPIKIVCGWCGKDIGETGFVSSEKGKISHGICKECSEKMVEEIHKIEK